MDSLQLLRLKTWLGDFPSGTHLDEVEPYNLAWLADQHTSTDTLRALLNFVWKEISAAHNAIEEIFRRIGYVNASAMPQEVVRTIKLQNEVIAGGAAATGGLRTMGDELLRGEIVAAAKHCAWLNGILEQCLEKVTRLDGVSPKDLDLELLAKQG